jgi:hypothetical protein
MLFRLKLLALLFTASAAMRSQAPGPCAEHSAIVNALDANGAPLKNLLAGNFKVSHRGRLLDVAWLQHREDPSGRVVVLLDTSGSMKGDFEGGSAKWKIAHAAALEFVSSAPLQTQVSFMAFSSGIGQKFAGLGDRQPIEDWLNRSTSREGKEVKGHTALYDTILEALKGFEQTQPGDAIYVITDGGDNASTEKLSQLERSLEGSGVRLFAFLLNGPAMISREQSGVADLYELARVSGGSVVSVSPKVMGSGLNANYYFGKNTEEAIRASTAMLQAEIRSFYLLAVRFPGIPARFEDWKIEVVDERGRRRKDVMVAYPHKVTAPACAAQSAQR